MRKVNTADVFRAVRIISDSGLREELAPIIKRYADKGADALEEVGILGILSTLEVVGGEKTERAIYNWLAGICETAPDDIAAMDLESLAAMLDELKNNNTWQVFFKSVSGLMKSR